MSEKISFPGFIDVHVHFRDPGIPEAETTASGLEAARRGGFGAVVTMPNTVPACDSVELLDYQRSFDSPVLLFPSACITKGRAGRELADLERLAEAGAALFTDDGGYVESARLMEEAMARAARLDFCVADHGNCIYYGADPLVQFYGIGSCVLYSWRCAADFGHRPF